MAVTMCRSTRSAGSRSPNARRGQVLRAVVSAANERRDAVLPWDLPGVSDTFSDDFTLVSALQLRWHTRLGGTIERALVDRPGAPEAVLDAWRATVHELAGVRLILDAYAAAPTSAEMADALATAQRKDWVLMAAMAGLAGPSDQDAVRVGHELEQVARSGLGPDEDVRDSGLLPRHRAHARPATLLGRIKAALAA